MVFKIGARMVSHGRFGAFQMAEVAIPRISLLRRLKRALLAGLAGGVASLLFLFTELSWWGLLAGFVMGGLYFGIADLVRPKADSQTELRLGGALAGALAACAGWWIHEGEMSMTVWAVLGAGLGAMFCELIPILYDDNHETSSDQN